MNISEKINKLLALAANNDNANEAALAMARAQALMVEHAISEDMLKGDPLHVNEPIETQAMGMGFQRIPHWEISLLDALSRSFFCRVWYRAGRDAYMCGRTSDRAALKATFEYLRAECKRLAEVAWNGQENAFVQVHGKRWKTAFYEGVAQTVRVRMTDAMKLLVVDNAGTAIVLANRQKDVDLWVNANLRLRAGARGKGVDSSGFNQGKAAGHALNLDKRAGANRQLGA